MKSRKKEINRGEEKEEEDLKMVKKKSKDKKKKRDRKKNEKKVSTTPTATPKDASGEEPMSTDDACQTTPSKSNINGNRVSEESREVRILLTLALVDKSRRVILQYFGCKMIILCNVSCFTANHVHGFLLALKKSFFKWWAIM